VGQVLFDPDYDSERRDLSRSRPDAYELWLDPGMRDVSAASDLLNPYDPQQMRCYPVSTRINHVANDDEDCSAPVKFAAIQDRLFL
jgi:putative SOS response-associated peptidase YedK